MRKIRVFSTHQLDVVAAQAFAPQPVRHTQAEPDGVLVGRPGLSVKFGRQPGLLNLNRIMQQDETPTGFGEDRL